MSERSTGATDKQIEAAAKECFESDEFGDWKTLNKPSKNQYLTSARHWARLLVPPGFVIVPSPSLRSASEQAPAGSGLSDEERDAAQKVCDIDAWRPTDPVPGWYLTEECAEWQGRRREAIDDLRAVLARMAPRQSEQAPRGAAR